MSHFTENTTEVIEQEISYSEIDPELKKILYKILERIKINEERLDKVKDRIG